MRALLRLFPRDWRERYGDEVLELIERRGWRPGDAANLMSSAAMVWMEHLMRAAKEDWMHRLLIVGIALVVVGAVTTTWAVTELSNGLLEIPMHWWSTAAALPLALGVLLTAWGMRQRLRTSNQG